MRNPLRYACWVLAFAFQFLSAAFRKQLCKINLSVVEHCNSRCGHCRIWELPAEAYRPLSHFDSILMNLPHTISWLSITGGEPFLHPGLLEIAQNFLSGLPRLRMISITTNGLLVSNVVRFTEKLLDQNPKLLLYVNISMDGKGKAHDEIRGISGNFEKINELRRELRSLKLRFGFRLRVCLETTLIRSNAEHLHSIREMSARGGEEHMVVVGEGRAYYRNQGSSDPFLSREEARSVLMKYGRSSHWLRSAYYAGARKFLKDGLHPVPCSAGEQSIFIRSDGTVQPCIHWSRALGSVVETNLEELRSSAGSRELRSEIQKQNCPGCWTPCEAMTSLMGNPMRALFG